MTTPEARDPALDVELMAYADGTLDPGRRVEVEARLARDAEARDAVAQWRHFDNLIRQTGRAADELPANLRIEALERQLAARLQRRRWQAALMGPRMRQVAASVAIFAAGWGAHALYGAGDALVGHSHPGFVQSTLDGHLSHVLASQQRAEFAGDDMTEALEWLSAQMQRKIDSPKLERLGYRVESARLIVVDDAPVAVFYYRNAEDERVTVSMTPQHATQPHYALRMAKVQDDRMAYWTADAMHYTVVAKTDAARITALAAAVQP